MPVILNQVNTTVANSGINLAKEMFPDPIQLWCYYNSYQSFGDDKPIIASNATREDVEQAYYTLKGNICVTYYKDIEAWLKDLDDELANNPSKRTDKAVKDVINLLQKSKQAMFACLEELKNQYNNIYTAIEAVSNKGGTSLMLSMAVGNGFDMVSKTHNQDYLDKMQALSTAQLDPAYSAEQNLVIKSVKDITVVNAVAGCGKSTCLSARFYELMRAGFAQTELLCTTFTNLGADSLKAKIPDVLNIMTLYSFFARLSNGANQNKTQVLVYDFLSMIEPILDTYNINFGYSTTILDVMNDLNALTKAKRTRFFDEVVASQAYSEYVCVEMYQLLVMYRYLVPDMKAVPYGDCVKVLMIDESQDLSFLDIVTLIAIWNNNDTVENIMFVGDSCQSIYGFRGSMPSLMDNISNQPNVATYDLTTNYRSSAAVINAADTCRFDSKNSSVGQTTYSGNVIDSSSADELIDFVKNSMAQGQGVALLSNTKRGVNDLIDFMAVNLSVNAVDISTPKAYVFRNTKMKAWLDRFDRKVKKNNVSPLSIMSYWHTDILDPNNADAHSYKSMERNIATVHTNFKMRLNDKLIKAGILNPALASNPNAQLTGLNIDKNLVYDAFEESINDWIADVNKRNSIRQSALMTQLRESVLQGTGVYAGTVHASKGLEFDNVVYHKVSSKNRGTSQEEQNLDYVAKSRARYNHFTYKPLDLLISRK